MVGPATLALAAAESARDIVFSLGTPIAHAWRITSGTRRGPMRRWRLRLSPSKGRERKALNREARPHAVTNVQAQDHEDVESVDGYTHDPHYSHSEDEEMARSYGRSVVYYAHTEGAPTVPGDNG